MIRWFQRQWLAILVGWLGAWFVIAVWLRLLIAYAVLFSHAIDHVQLWVLYAVLLISGLVVTVVLVLLAWLSELVVLRLRGYGAPTRAERAAIEGTMAAVAERMDVLSVPAVLVHDDPVPAAWMHQRTVVLTTGLLGMRDPAALAGILAHELAHHDAGDAAGIRLAWMSAWPLVLLFNAVMWFGGGPVRRMPLVQAGPGGMVAGQAESRTRQGVEAGARLCRDAGALRLHAALHPSVALRPLRARGRHRPAGRQAEYDADAAAKAAGYGPGLIRALTQLVVWEPPRSGWEDAITAQHPPIPLRIDELQL